MKRFLSLHLPIDDLKLIRQIGTWALKFTPLVGVERDVTREMARSSPLSRGLVLDISGMDRLYGGPLGLAEMIASSLRAREISHSIAVAPSIGSGWALSRFGARALLIASTSTLKTELAPLPVAALRLSEKAISGLHEVGLTRLGDLFPIPPKTLALRFGIEILTRLDQMFGRIDEPLRLLKVREALTCSKRFEYPLIRHESVKKALLILLERIMSKLHERSLKAGSFVITVNSSLSKEVSLYSASERFSHVATILEPFIESLQVPGGISHLSITACTLEQKKGDQSNFARDPTYPPPEPGELITTLITKLGDTRVTRAVFHPSFIPERSFAYTPLSSAPSTGGCTILRERPPYLLPEPQRIHAIAMLPDKPPSWIRWGTEKLKVSGGIGPERISSEWWNEGLSVAGGGRDYFRLQDEQGRWLWVFRDVSSMEWFIHGLWV